MTGPVRAARDLLQTVAAELWDYLSDERDATELYETLADRCMSAAAGLGPAITTEDGGAS